MGAGSYGATGFSGGSGGRGGYRYQALAAAYVAAHALACQPLNWVGSIGAVPLAVWAETGGPGDDLKVEFVSGPDLEIQAKKGQEKNAKLWKALPRRAVGSGGGRGAADAPAGRPVRRTASPASVGLRRTLSARSGANLGPMRATDGPNVAAPTPALDGAAR